MNINKIFFILYLLLSPVTPIKAETHVYNDGQQQNLVWNKENSPYILEETINIAEGSSLHIKDGVEVRSSMNNNDESYSLNIEGVLRVSGTEENPVSFIDLYNLYFYDSESTINNAVFTGTGLDFTKSTSTIESVSISDAFSGITARGSRVDISGSSLSGNNYGIASYYEGPIFQVRIPLNVGGLGNVFATAVNPEQNIIKIHDSVIVDNRRLGIMNQTENVVEASDNWWGSADDPSDKISGLVSVSPWKEQEPATLATCCSNVLFIPGTQASRLYKDSNMLWEPNRNADVEKMFMNEQGVSIDQSIKTKDIISSAYGVKDIYKSFISYVDDMVSRDFINEWKPLPYDWRRGVYDLVSVDTINELQKLASTSKTGKVTVIAHSNGGLVTKSLMRKLEAEGVSSLVDRIIFVAVPELGTPQALFSMLHGHNQGIAGGLFLSENTARNFSKNLGGAYGLLPSRRFFEQNPVTVISDLFSMSSEQKSSSYESMLNFLTKNSFSKASSTDLDIPVTLNPYLLSLSDSFHSIIDKWKPGTSTKTLAILGWGVPTSKSIKYERDAHCKNKNTKCDVSMSRTVTSAGDGTVITDANSELADETIFFDLKKLKKDTKEDIKHADILESKELQNIITDTIADDEGISNEDYKKYFSNVEPTDDDKWLYIRVYSPVDIHVYDKEGNHTGIVDNPVSGVDLEPYESAIPGSVYDGFGRTKQVVLPYGDEYEIRLKGTDTGVFSIHTEVMQADAIMASTTFSELPVTSTMNVDFVIATSTTSFASSTVMYIDMDGDGVSETLHNSDQFLKANGKDKKYHKKFKKIMKKILKKKLAKYKNK